MCGVLSNSFLRTFIERISKTNRECYRSSKIVRTTSEDQYERVSIKIPKNELATLKIRFTNMDDLRLIGESPISDGPLAN